ncbi:unnamed protein product [Phytophthora fragariaefolia]|uniref:Unnamed protein product n=1 Tax=Phytophthora fragariaefolia TaxID=1490495 RepID=A0A9W6XRU3_9STRA|nr:unnamed protein product [Phytophthora fragariaefolia]
MEKRKSVRRRTEGTKTSVRGVASDAESTVSTRSSNSSKSNNSSASWKQKQRRVKTERISSRGNPKAAEQEQVGSDEDSDEQSKSLEVRLGAILETTEAQVTMILLIALDVACTALEMHLHDQQQVALALQQLNSSGDEGLDAGGSVLVRMTTRLVESFTGFTLFLFLIELAVLIAAFRRQFFAHVGYMLDVAVVAITLTMELYAQSKGELSMAIAENIWSCLTFAL